MSTFSTAITGLKANQQMIGITGDNIANANTPGFKAGRAVFADLLVQTMEGATAPSGTTGGTDPFQIGAGTRVASIDVMHSQGTIEPTGRSSDLAIQGNGFFVLSSGQQTVYTRAGVFEVDANGNLVDAATGLQVQGSKGAIMISLGTNAPTATTEVELTGNLNAAAVDNLTTPEDETAVDTSFFVIDSLGGQNMVKVSLTKAGSGTDWSYEVFGPVTTASSGASLGSGTITFSSSGVFTSAVSGGPFSLDPGNGADPVAFSIDFGSPDRSTSMTGYASPSSVSMVSQDGVSQGSLVSFTVGSDGVVTGMFSNGRSQVIDTLKLASFSNPSGLMRLSDNHFLETPNSGVAVVGTAGTGGRGTITAGALEQSNVDLATEFVNLIIAQRGYEANARVVTVADQIQQTTVNLVR